MKKLFALILAICLSVTVLSALAEEGDVIGYYPDDHPESKVFMSTWVAEGGNWRIEMYGEDGSIKPYIVHRLGDNKEDIWEYATELDKDNINQLTAEPVGLHYKQDTVSGNWDTTYYEDGNATFVLNENGKLIWNDLKEDAGKGFEFEKIGEFFGGRWTKGDIEVQFAFLAGSQPDDDDVVGLRSKDGTLVFHAITYIGCCRRGITQVEHTLIVLHILMS